MKELESAGSQGSRHGAIAACLWAFVKTGRVPSRRAVAAFAKLHGSRMERTWPYLKRAQGSAINLAFDDVLEFQYARSRNFRFMFI
ncbi:MAG: hypothetical protein JWO88_3756, partial [Frankiales bacterium]|nr:hypothetical protein [Frankiales bacterium]